MQESLAQKKKSIRVPDLPKELFKDQNLDTTYLTSNTPPFYSTTERITMEKDNTDPNFLRSTMYTIPTSEFSLECIALPLSIIATPFSDKGTLEFASGIDSCLECRTIFNNFTKTENTSYTCNICGKSTSFLPKFIENLSFSSFEVILSEATSLNKKATGYDSENQAIEYPFVKELLKPTFFFMFDMSSFLLVEKAVEFVQEIVKNENFQLLFENVGFFILNNGITAFSVKKDSICCHKFKENSSFISPKCVIKSKELNSISLILKEILMNTERTAPDHKSITNAIKSVSAFTIASKIAIFSSCSANFEYESILTERMNVCVNTFSLSSDTQKNTKIGSSLDKLAFFTTGQIFKYSPLEVFSLKQDLKSICLTRSVYDINLVFKTSDNLIKKDVIASSFEPSFVNSHVNHMDSNSSITFSLGLDGVSKLTKYVQLQVYFTDFDGSRRLRVFNHMFPVGAPMQVFTHASFDTVFAAMVKQNLANDLPIDKPLINSLICYKEKCSSNNTASQLILPDGLKCLPVLIQGFLKKINLDKARLINSNVEQTLRYFYPRMISLSDYVMECDLLKTKSLNLSITSLTDDDIYILENSYKIFIYVPKNADSVLVDRLFEEQPEGVVIKSGEEEECVILRTIIENINQHYNQELKVSVCLAGKSLLEGEFISNLIEDANNGIPDYIDYIFKLHFQIQKQ